MSLVEAVPVPSSSRALTIAAHAAFVPIGFVTVILGPMLPALSERWSLNYAQGARLFTVQLLASTVAVALSGVLVSLWGFRFTIVAGLLAMAAGIGALPFCSHLAGLLCIASYGFGSGLATPAANIVVAEVNPDRRSAALNRLNFSWSLGAVACPFLAATAMAIHWTQFLLVAISTFLFLVAVGIATIPFEGMQSPVEGRGKKLNSVRSFWRQTRFLMLAGIFFLYIGTEVGFGGWITTTVGSLPNSPKMLAVALPSFFYGALTVGRGVASLFLKHVGEIKLARAGLLIAVAGMAGMIAAHDLVTVVLTVIVAGFGLAAVYPIAIWLLSEEFADAASQAGSVMFTLANLGGACLPWLVGNFSKQFGNPKAGLAIPLVSALLMYALYQANWKCLRVEASPG
jgi:FHS family glucose/mannose:H+ symporter-like MFS transporter